MTPPIGSIPEGMKEALAYFRPHEKTGDSSSVSLTAGKMRKHLSVIEDQIATGHLVRSPGEETSGESEFDRGVAFGWKSASGLIQTHRDMQEKATARAETAEAARLKAEAERDKAVAALAIANTGSLKLLYAIREAVGFNDKTSLSLLPDRCRRLFEIASRNEALR